MLTLLKKTLQKPFLTLYGIESEKAYWSSSIDPPILRYKLKQH